MSDHFLKWYPENAMTSPRWRRLTLEQKGLFHELYDFASTCDPRGTLSTNGLPMTGAELAHYFGMDEDRFSALFLPMTQQSLSLIKQSSKKRFMFPDWQRHQRNAPFRTRHIGADLAQEWREIGAPDVEVDVEVDKETDTARSARSGGFGFAEFWKTYPRKVGKKAAQKAWVKAKDKPELKVILAAIEAQKASDQWTKDSGQFIPYPATWLNQGRWADEIGEAGGNLIASWKAARLEPPRHTVAEILKDVRQAVEYLKRKDLEIWDSGKARNEKVVAWAKQAEILGGDKQAGKKEAGDEA